MSKIESKIVEEVRDQYAARFGYDVEVICRDLRERQGKGGHRVVQLDPKKYSLPSAATELPSSTS